MGVIVERCFMFKWITTTHPCELSDSSFVHCLWTKYIFTSLKTRAYHPIILHFLSVINGSHPLDLAPLKTKTAFSWSPGWLGITSKAWSPQHCRILMNFPEKVHLPVSALDNDHDYDNSNTILHSRCSEPNIQKSSQQASLCT